MASSLRTQKNNERNRVKGNTCRCVWERIEHFESREAVLGCFFRSLTTDGSKFGFDAQRLWLCSLGIPNPLRHLVTVATV